MTHTVASPSHNKKALILLSGGLDSATTTAIAKTQGFDCHALSFNYGQRHSIELQATKKLVTYFKIKKHIVFPINLELFGGSALTDSIAVPKNNDLSIRKKIPITYVPARNTIFLSLALAYAETTQIFDIFIGANHVDYSGYPDCRPEFLNAFEKMANLAIAATENTNQRIRIHAPLLQLSKAAIIKKGLELKVDYSLTTSCYDPDIHGYPCLQCDSCQIRMQGFEENHITDPLIKK